MTLCDSVYITCQKVFLSLRFVNSKGEITEGVSQSSFLVASMFQEVEKRKRKKGRGEKMEHLTKLPLQDVFMGVSCLV